MAQKEEEIRRWEGKNTEIAITLHQGQLFSKD